MKNDIDSLHEELKTRLDRERLTAISADIIARYRDRDIAALAWYAALLDIPFNEKNLNRLFAGIIQRYHPDKLARLREEMEARHREADEEGLIKMKRAYLFAGWPGDAAPSPRRGADEDFRYEEDDYDYEEEYVYDEESAVDDEFKDDEDEGFDEEEAMAVGRQDGEFGFIEAINKYIFGNLDLTVDTHDMKILEGELNLSDYEITDLKGIELCVNVTSINLSGNSIYKITPLASLANLERLYMAENCVDNIDSLAHCRSLRELDVSFNDIEDIAALLKLPKLEYVNLIGNPVEDTGVIEELRRRNVLVLY